MEILIIIVHSSKYTYCIVCGILSAAVVRLSAGRQFVRTCLTVAARDFDHVVYYEYVAA